MTRDPRDSDYLPPFNTTQPVLPSPSGDTNTGGAATDLGASYWLTHPMGGSNNVISGPISAVGDTPTPVAAAPVYGAAGGTQAGITKLPDAPNIPSPIMVNPAGGTKASSSPVGSFAISLGAAILAFYLWEQAKKHKAGNHAK